MAVPRSAELVGRVLADRYRLMRPIGMGASARVYVADDVVLRRRVAVKVLHPGLVEDEAFLRRFRAEARLVAALRHQSILRVYDSGEDDGDPFLVTELLEGGSLRSVLDSGHRLSLSQAAAIGADAASALAYAHGRGLVHRDIKPANLLFDEEGRVSIADFGLARALAEATWTEPTGAIVGTARYAAPEQVRGQALDERADVYSLAVVLVEAVTGEPPFRGDTAFGTLMARLENPLEVSDELSPLAPALRAAGTIEPSERIDAKELHQMLTAAASELPEPGSLPLLGLQSGAWRDEEPTAIPRLGQRTTESPSELFAPPPPASPDEETQIAAGYEWEPPDPAMAIPPSPAPSILETEKPKRKRKKWLAVLAAVWIVAFGIAAAVFLLLPAPSYNVPALQGDTVAAATKALAAQHLRIVVQHTYDRSPAGTVVSQSPAPPARLQSGQTVVVQASEGPPPVAVPDLSQLQLPQIRTVLSSLGLTLGTVQDQPSTSVPNGLPISWSDKGQKIAQGAAVNVVISTGPPTVAIPQPASGATFAAEQAALSGVGLQATQQQAWNNTIPAGQVVSLSPAAGTTVQVGSTVTVTISKGPDLVQIPKSIVGENVSQAVATLSQVGIGVYEVKGDPTAPVVGAEPGVGSQVIVGQQVILVTHK